MTLPADNFTGSAALTGERTLVDALLDEQRRLTAVEAFARAHERHAITEPHYRRLLPASAPRPGEQYAFEVDLDKCSGCQACVTACHSLNGLDDGEAWREVGALFGEATMSCETGGNRVVPLQQTVTTACHHCVEPGCLEGCPVLAYDKDPLTGIVRHLDDQCIGCSYCILKCPYDVPKYSEARGIVRKCDLCHGRLAAGEAPACVQACPNEAIRITTVTASAVRTEFTSGVTESWSSGVMSQGSTTPSLHHSNSFLPDSPLPHITLPATRYVSKKPAADLRAADHNQPRPQPAHWPLILMLVLTQAGIGGLLADAALRVSGAGVPPALVNQASRLDAATSPSGTLGGLLAAGTAAPLPLVSLALLFAGLTASVFHLGQPLKAWRVWLGWRTSWLSREAMLLNVVAGVAVTSVAAALLPIPHLPSPISHLLFPVAFAAVFAQAMVYADTHRAFWSLSHTAPRFFGSVLVLGLTLALALHPTAPFATALLLATLLKLACELAVLKHADTDSDRWTQLRRTAALQTGPLRPVLGARLLAALAGGVFIPFVIATGETTAALAISAFTLCLLGELAERHLFFTTVSPDKMPV
jgi:formate dehydrogenase iron-sulfur subunit